MPTSLEVLARLGRALHRLHTRGRPPSRIVAFEDVEVDFDRGQARKGEAVVSLRAKELDLLRRLVDNSPTVIPREGLLLTVWAYQDGVSTRTVDVHMANLRRKLEDNPRRPRHLRTVRGVGYRFVA
jgi:DNA-binding response OmpR family regulator